MRHFFLTIIFLFTSVFCFSQNSIQFNKVLIPYPGANTIRTVVKTDTNYLLIFDNREANAWHQNNAFVIIDKQGNIIDSTLIKDTLFKAAIFPGNSAVRTKEGGFVICTNRTDTNSIDFGYLIKLNKNLDTIWTRKFRHPDTIAASQPGADVFNTFTAIKQTYDGGYIITANYNKDCITGNLRSYLLKIDSTGNFKWCKVYQNLTSIFDIEIAPDSGYYFVLGLNGNINLYKTNELGNVEWDIVVNSNSIPAGMPMSVELDNSNNIIVGSAFYYDLPNDLRGLTITKVNPLTQNIIWEKNYYLNQSFVCQTLHQSMEIECLANDNIIVSGTSSVLKFDSTVAGYKGVMLKLNSNGDSLWSRYYHLGTNFKDQCQFNDMVLTDDNGFLAVGYQFPSDASYSSVGWLVKMDSLGNAPGSYTVGVDEHYLTLRQAQCSVYPNPSSDNINLSFDNNPKSKITIQIYNSVGVLVKQEKHTASKQEYRINIEDLESGVYFISILSEGKKLFSGKFVKN